MNSVNDVAPVSVIIPCFRCASTIGRAMDSVLRQSYLPAEVILVDDASGDGTLNILIAYRDQYPNLVKVISLTENVGAGSARNMGWRVATEPYIAFLDADDSWHTDKIQIQCSHMICNPETVLCGHQWVFVDADSEAADLPKEWARTQINPSYSLFKNPFATSTIMLTRDTSFRFEQGMRSAEDLLLWLRIAFAGLRTVRLELPLGCVYKPLYGSGGLSGNLWKMEKGELICLATLYREASISRSLFCISVLFSILKFFKRVLQVHIMRQLKVFNINGSVEQR